MPQTFMNLSGESVQPAAAFYDVKADGVIVLHDELDLSFGVMRVKQAGGHAGHNGLRSIIAQLGVIILVLSFMCSTVSAAVCQVDPFMYRCI